MNNKKQCKKKLFNQNLHINALYISNKKKYKILINALK